MKNGSYYIGYTNNLQERLKMHNLDKVKATRNKGPWQVFHTEKYINGVDAIHREQQVKRWKSRKSIERLKFY